MDLIDRQAAIDGILEFMPPRLKDNATSAEHVNYSAWQCAINCAATFVRTMPSAQPTQPNTLEALDCISRQAAIDYCYALINAENPSDPHDEWNYSQERISQTEVILHHLEFMPSAQRKGKWMETDAAPHRIYCSECYTTFIPNKEWIAWKENMIPRKYCPNCGADMRE